MQTCNRCAECCKFVILDKIKPTKDYLEYYRVRGWRYDPATKLTWIPCVCQHLLEDNSCGIYEDRPEYCKKYPLKTPGAAVPDSCAFVKNRGNEEAGKKCY
jgi:Fe-S-cluster containining protein